MITQLAAVLAIVAALMLGALRALAIARRERSSIPLIGQGIAHRTRQRVDWHRARAPTSWEVILFVT